MEELIYSYFPNLSQEQKIAIKRLYPLYLDWNSKINVISRKDIDNIYIHHVLHSLAIAKFIEFPAGSKILDVGTGGGFPGIPLAILFPESSFYLCDSVLKKIKVVNEISSALSLKNVTAEQIRAEDINFYFDFVISRAVTELKGFIPWVWEKIKPGKYSDFDKGIIYLKGGDLKQEIQEAIDNTRINSKNISEIPINKWFTEEYFEEKKVLFIKR